MINKEIADRTYMESQKRAAEIQEIVNKAIAGLKVPQLMTVYVFEMNRKLEEAMHRVSDVLALAMRGTEGFQEQVAAQKLGLQNAEVADGGQA